MAPQPVSAPAVIFAMTHLLKADRETGHQRLHEIQAAG